MKSTLNPLTYRERKFVDALPLTTPPFNGTQAAIQAGYGKAGAAVEAVRLLRKPNVSSEIEAMKTATSKRHQITKDRLIREVARSAFVDPGAYFDSHGNPIDARDPARSDRDHLLVQQRQVSIGRERTDQ